MTRPGRTPRGKARTADRTRPARPPRRRRHRSSARPPRPVPRATSRPCSDRRLAATRMTAEIAASTHRPRNTVRTSAMWACSRPLRTGVPSTWTSKLPPSTRSVRIALAGGPQLVGGEARPGRRLGAALFEGDPLRRQERQDRASPDDHDRSRQPDQDGRSPAPRGLHRVILARMRPTSRRRAEAVRPTRPGLRARPDPLQVSSPRLVPPSLESEVGLAGRRRARPRRVVNCWHETSLYGRSEGVFAGGTRP